MGCVHQYARCQSYYRVYALRWYIECSNTSMQLRYAIASCRDQMRGAVGSVRERVTQELHKTRTPAITRVSQ
jgi:hypothetical protein